MFIYLEHEKQNSYPKEDTEYQKITLSFCLHKLIAEVLNHRWYVHIQDRIRVHNHHIQHIQDQNIHIRVQHIQDQHHSHRLHREDQHQLTSYHSNQDQNSHSQDHNHHIQHIQDRNIHIQVQDIPDQHHIHILHSTDQHQPLAQHQQTSCHSSQDQHSR